MLNFIKNWIAEDYRILNGDCAGKPRSILNLLLMIVSFPIIFVIGGIAFLFGFIKRLYQIFIGNRLETLFYGKYNQNKCKYTTKTMMRMCEVDKVFFDTREHAEEIIDKIADLFNVHNVVTLKDYFALAGMEHIDSNYSNYGWSDRYDIYDFCVYKTRDGYAINFPAARYLWSDHCENRNTKYFEELSHTAFKTEEEAKAIIEEMQSILNEFNQVTVSDFLELAGKDIPDFTCSMYGWTYDHPLGSARIGKSSKGYGVLLPDPIHLD